MSRKQSREEIFKLVFEYAMTKEIDETALNESVSTFVEDSKYIKNVYNGVIEHFDELSELIGSFSTGFAIDRIYKIDLAILLVALYEIKYVDDIPANVSINEALNLSKIYSTDKSSGFINGILANFVK